MIRKIEMSNVWIGCLSFFFQRLAGVRGSGRLVSSLFLQCIFFCGGKRAISDFNRSLRSCYFVRVVNERTSVASVARTLEGARLIIRKGKTDLRSDPPFIVLYICCCVVARWGIAVPVHFIASAYRAH